MSYGPTRYAQFKFPTAAPMEAATPVSACQILKQKCECRFKLGSTQITQSIHN